MKMGGTYFISNSNILIPSLISEYAPGSNGWGCVSFFVWAWGSVIMYLFNPGSLLCQNSQCKNKLVTMGGLKNVKYK